MNVEFELPPEPQIVPAAPVTPEQQLQKYEADAMAIALADDASVQVALYMIAKLKEFEAQQDTERKALTDPLNAQIRTISTPYTNRREKAHSLRLNLEGRLFQYRQELERKRQEEQRRINYEAEQDRLKKEREAEAARQKAADAREQGNEVEAAKQEGKAQRAELVAASVVPTVLAAAPKTTELFDGSKLSTREVNDIALKCGLAEADYYRDDARLKDIPDEFWKLDWTALRKRVRSVKNPRPDLIPGILIVPKPQTVLRKGK